MSRTGSVPSLHVHPPIAGEPLIPLETINVVAGQGIVESKRYFGRKSRRHVTLIEREQLAEHAGALGLDQITPGAVRANIETTGIDLRNFVKRRVRVGEAVLEIYGVRTPCQKMDAICHGLRARIEHGKQGVLAMVIQSGAIHVGDKTVLLPDSAG